MRLAHNLLALAFATACVGLWLVMQVLAMRRLESAWSLADFTPAARHASAKRILQLWQQTGDDDGAKPYLRALEHLALADSRERRPIDEGDLP